MKSYAEWVWEDSLTLNEYRVRMQDEEAEKAYYDSFKPKYDEYGGVGFTSRSDY